MAVATANRGSLSIRPASSIKRHVLDRFRFSSSDVIPSFKDGRFVSSYDLGTGWVILVLAGLSLLDGATVKADKRLGGPDILPSDIQKGKMFRETVFLQCRVFFVTDFGLEMCSVYKVLPT